MGAFDQRGQTVGKQINVDSPEKGGTYRSVEDYFRAELPELVEMLNNTGGFWSGVKENLTPNAALVKIVQISSGQQESTVYQAALAVLLARALGKLSTPA